MLPCTGDDGDASESKRKCQRPREEEEQGKDSSDSVSSSWIKGNDVGLSKRRTMVQVSRTSDFCTVMPRVPLDEADDEEPRADCVTPRRRGGDLYLSFLTRCDPLTPLHLRCT
ncbi:hypothetical protein EVAR_46776_1 [Eumeta japonica]|uniref:Uncharacterized protein n=1 Tax=Eumeta variegata TaxID=151549 RepID=A0A4C1XFZ3_EUMVA|nr:hypothetical protein EVAR_46776_1 [Eumeta japonica]